MSKTSRSSDEPAASGESMPVGSPSLTERNHVIVVRALCVDRSRYTAYFSTRTGDRTLAQDLFQELCLRAIERSDALRRSELVAGWLYRIAHSVLVDHMRSNTSRAWRETTYASELLLLQPAVVDDEAVDNSCLCPIDLLDDLADLDRHLLQKIYMQGHSRAALSGELGISQASLRVRLHRARKALREAVLNVCGNCVTPTQFNQCFC